MLLSTLSALEVIPNFSRSSDAGAARVEEKACSLWSAHNCEIVIVDYN